MTEALSLSLQAFRPPDKDKESLQYLIQRVNAQRGSFRNVTEQSLEDEIRNPVTEEDHKDQADATNPVADPGDPKTKKEEVAKAREEILKLTAQAFQETSTALEFVSLVLSKHAPAAAQTTISPFLKQTVPLGSLGVEVVQAPQVSELEKHNDEMVGIGWRMKSLNGAADSLLKSASRLEEEMGRETRYWEQVLEIKEKGWSLHRLPREKHTLGVRYGFAEAYSDFRDRGLAALRREEDGSLSLERGLRWRGDRKLRVRILHQGKPIADNVRGIATATEDMSVERQILNARDSIYDEELHHELDREARNLINQGVRCIDGSILLPYETTKQIEISLVPKDEEVSTELESGDPVPEAIAISLRILLSHAHRQNLQSRSRMPLPLRENKAPRKIYALIKPILEYLQDKSHVESTQAYLQGLINTMKAAGINILMEQTSSHDFRDLQNANDQSGTSGVDRLLRILTSPQHTSWTLTFPNESTIITIDIHTAIEPPHFGTTFQITMVGTNLEQTKDTLPSTEQFTSTNTFQTHILHLVTLAVQHALLSKAGSWQIVSIHDHSMMRKRAKGQGKDIASLEVSKERLSLSWRSAPSGQSATWSWFAGDANGQGQKGHLFDIFRRI